MHATTTPPHPDPTRTGAVWVTATGAFLLLAAAAVFTAVRWDDIPDAAKLGVLGLATGICLVAGRGLKTSLPATAGALFHLGAFLVPIDVAAMGVRADLDWSTMLLAQGLAATATFGWAARTEGSVVLRWSFAVAVVALAGGIGATTDLPAPAVLAAFAATAVALRKDDLACGWAALAGLAPLLTFAEELTYSGSGALVRLGLAGEQPRLTAVLTGVASAVVLGIVGRRRDDAGLVLVGVALATVGVAASWTGTHQDASTTVVGLATAFLLVELTALATRHDAFWRQPSAVVARVAEGAAVLATGAAVIPVLAAPYTDRTDPQLALAVLTLGAGWLAADRRHGHEGLVLGAIAGAICVSSAVALGTGNDVLLGLTLTAIAALAVLSDHRAAAPIAVVAAAWAPATVPDAPTALVAVGVAGTLIVTEAAVRLTRRPATDQRAADRAEQWAWVVAGLALLPGASAATGFIAASGHATAVLVGFAVLATVAAAGADRARVRGSFPLGTVPRVAALAVLAPASDLPPAAIGVVALAVAALSIGDAVRSRTPMTALGASVALPVAIGALAQAADLSVPASGVALCVSAAVLTGLGALAGRRWAVPFGAAVGIAALGGLALASHDARSFADAVMITSGIAMAVSVERGRLDGILLSGLTLTGGIWLRLAVAEVTVSEPYLVPVAVLLLGAGLRARSIATSSWIAYGPVIGLLGGAAFAERVTGGAGWHGLVVGVVGVAAVVAGGQRRLAAPLLLGTGLLVGLVGYETLAITAAVPTWAWLAVGGAALLSAGLAMERHDLGPLETGRRLVDVVDEHFA